MWMLRKVLLFAQGHRSKSLDLPKFLSSIPEPVPRYKLWIDELNADRIAREDTASQRGDRERIVKPITFFMRAREFIAQYIKFFMRRERIVQRITFFLLGLPCIAGLGFFIWEGVEDGETVLLVATLFHSSVIVFFASFYCGPPETSRVVETVHDKPH
jgi:hypothetical protein